MRRISSVKSLTIRSMLNSAICQIGDSCALTPSCKVLAVARQLPIFHDIEDEVPNDPIYTRPIPIPKIHDQVNVMVKNTSPFIKVGNISVNGISTSAVVHIGSTKHIKSEARVKHMRQFIYPPAPIIGNAEKSNNSSMPKNSYKNDRL